VAPEPLQNAHIPSMYAAFLIGLRFRVSKFRKAQLALERNRYF